MHEEPGELALLALGGEAATIFYGCGVVISFSLVLRLRILSKSTYDVSSAPASILLGGAGQWAVGNSRRTGELKVNDLSIHDRQYMILPDNSLFLATNPSYSAPQELFSTQSGNQHT